MSFISQATKVAGYVLLLGFLAGSSIAAEFDADKSNVFETRHGLAVFLGNTHSHHGEDAFTVGLEYEHRLTELFGIGFVGEYAGKNIDTWLFGMHFALHPLAGWRLVAMPGIEVDNGETEFLFRTGVGYEFEFDSFVIIPQFHADFVDSKVNYVFGVGFGVLFWTT